MSDNNKVISDEAVEAVAKALYFYLDEDHRAEPDPWESLPEDDDAKIDAKDAARIALEAAAPHIAAEVWDDAMKNAADIAWEHDASASSAISKTTNPYRRQA